MQVFSLRYATFHCFDPYFIFKFLIFQHTLYSEGLTAFGYGIQYKITSIILPYWLMLPVYHQDQLLHKTLHTHDHTCETRVAPHENTIQQYCLSRSHPKSGICCPQSGSLILKLKTHQNLKFGLPYCLTSLAQCQTLFQRL